MVARTLPEGEKVTNPTAFAQQQEADALKAQISTLKAEIAQVKAKYNNQTAEVERLLKFVDTINQVDPDRLVPVPWQHQQRRSTGHHATGVLLLSDLHLDEVVDPFETNLLNAYNREIAEMRLQRCIENAVKLVRNIGGITLDGLVVTLLGDIITGTIHAELERTNASTVPGTIVHWVPILAGAIQYLADELEVPIHVATVDGNHDRTYKLTPAKQRSISANTWVIYNWMAQSLSHDERITWNISVAPHNFVDVYDQRFLLEHGDAFKSSGGVGGLYPSLLKHLYRMHDLYPFDKSFMGHWHQYTPGRDFHINGSLKGLDEYALGKGFHFEPPMQSLLLVTPEHGVTQEHKVFAASPDEPWRARTKGRKVVRHGRR